MLRLLMCLWLLLATTVARADQPLDDLMTVEPISLEVGKDLVVLVDGKAPPLLTGVSALRQQLKVDRGFVLPGVRFRDDTFLQPREYVIYVREQEVGRGLIQPGKLLAVPKNRAALGALRGDPGLDALTGLVGRWVGPADKAKAEKAGCAVYDAGTVVHRHLKQVVSSNAHHLMGRQAMLDAAPPLLAGALSSDLAAQDRCLAVCHNLLQEGVPLHLNLVAETALDKSLTRLDADSVTEKIRCDAFPLICIPLAHNKVIPAATLSSALEAKLRGAVSWGPTGLMIANREGLADSLEAPLARVLKALPDQPVLLVADDLRLAVRRLTQRRYPLLTVLKPAEVVQGFSVKKVLEI
ncbi:FHIPEP family type III secretion protein [bacterium]|nr:FHIPEP family type III secretion protein [bacterium]